MGMPSFSSPTVAAPTPGGAPGGHGSPGPILHQAGHLGGRGRARGARGQLGEREEPAERRLAQGPAAALARLQGPPLPQVWHGLQHLAQRAAHRGQAVRVVPPALRRAGDDAGGRGQRGPRHPRQVGGGELQLHPVARRERADLRGRAASLPGERDAARVPRAAGATRGGAERRLRAARRREGQDLAAARLPVAPARPRGRRLAHRAAGRQGLGAGRVGGRGRGGGGHDALHDRRRALGRGRQALGQRARARLRGGARGDQGRDQRDLHGPAAAAEPRLRVRRRLVARRLRRDALVDGAGLLAAAGRAQGAGGHVLLRPRRRAQAARHDAARQHARAALEHEPHQGRRQGAVVRRAGHGEARRRAHREVVRHAAPGAPLQRQHPRRAQAGERERQVRAHAAARQPVHAQELRDARPQGARRGRARPQPDQARARRHVAQGEPRQGQALGALLRRAAPAAAPRRLGRGQGQPGLPDGLRGLRGLRGRLPVRAHRRHGRAPPAPRRREPPLAELRGLGRRPQLLAVAAADARPLAAVRGLQRHAARVHRLDARRGARPHAREGRLRHAARGHAQRLPGRHAGRLGRLGPRLGLRRPRHVPHRLPARGARGGLAEDLARRARQLLQGGLRRRLGRRARAGQPQPLRRLHDHGLDARGRAQGRQDHGAQAGADAPRAGHAGGGGAGGGQARGQVAPAGRDAPQPGRDQLRRAAHDPARPPRPAAGGHGHPARRHRLAALLLRAAHQAAARLHRQRPAGRGARRLQPELRRAVERQGAGARDQDDARVPRHHDDQDPQGDEAGRARLVHHRRARAPAAEAQVALRGGRHALGARLGPELRLRAQQGARAPAQQRHRHARRRARHAPARARRGARGQQPRGGLQRALRRRLVRRGARGADARVGAAAEGRGRRGRAHRRDGAPGLQPRHLGRRAAQGQQLLRAARGRRAPRRQRRDGRALLGAAARVGGGGGDHGLGRELDRQAAAAVHAARQGVQPGALRRLRAGGPRPQRPQAGRTAARLPARKVKPGPRSLGCCPLARVRSCGARTRSYTDVEEARTHRTIRGELSGIGSPPSQSSWYGVQSVQSTSFGMTNPPEKTDVRRAAGAWVWPLVLVRGRAREAAPACGDRALVVEATGLCVLPCCRVQL
eukprot:scaffold52663_cov65-Phaeocystis_antarctica.AAC.3